MRFSLSCVLLLAAVSVVGCGADPAGSSSPSAPAAAATNAPSLKLTYFTMPG